MYILCTMPIIVPGGPCSAIPGDNDDEEEKAEEEIMGDFRD